MPERHNTEPGPQYKLGDKTVLTTGKGNDVTKAFANNLLRLHICVDFDSKTDSYCLLT